MDNSTDKSVFLDESTKFDGDIKAKKVVLRGKVNGIVYAENELQLKSGAHIKGEIYTKNFSADEGCSCDSELHINLKEENEKNDSKVQPASEAENKNQGSFFPKVSNLFSIV